MRLTCPNCDAQYEVARDAIPVGGRDVQCSNCGHAWFQKSSGMEADAGNADEAASPDASNDLHQGVSTAAPPVERTTDAPALPDNELDDDEDDTEPAFEQAPPPKRRDVDESVLAVLREEAEREAAARRRDAEAAVATAPDVAPDAAPVVVPVAVVGQTVPRKIRPATVRPAIPDDKAVDPVLAAAQGMVLARPSRGRERLPDIEAIKSTLRASSDRPGGTGNDIALVQPYVEPRRPRGFRAGFLLIVAVGVLLVAAYVLAPSMAARVPAMAPALGSFVAGVDDARLWLDGLARRAGDSLTAQSVDAPATE